MESLFILIPIAIFFVFVAIGIFIWAVKSGQYEDLDRHSLDILFDEKTKSTNPLHQDEQAALLSSSPTDRAGGINSVSVEVRPAKNANEAKMDKRRMNE